jgi:hypothetical protein
MLGAGCSSLWQTSSPRPISSKPPKSAIVFSAPATVRDQTTIGTFPTGKYRPLYKDWGGYYFEARAKAGGPNIRDDEDVIASTRGECAPQMGASPRVMTAIGLKDTGH